MRQTGFKRAEEHLAEAKRLVKDGYDIAGTLSIRLKEKHEVVRSLNSYFFRVEKWIREPDVLKEARDVIADAITHEAHAIALAQTITHYTSSSSQGVYKDIFEDMRANFNDESAFRTEEQPSLEDMVRAELMRHQQLMDLYTQDYKGDPDLSKWMSKVLLPDEDLEAILQSLQNPVPPDDVKIPPRSFDLY